MDHLFHAVKLSVQTCNLKGSTWRLCRPWAACLQDAERLESLAKGLSSPADLKPAAEGTELQSLLGNIAERAQGGTEFLYTKFFAIGLFRLLELTGALQTQHRVAACCGHRPSCPKCMCCTLQSRSCAPHGYEVHALRAGGKDPKALESLVSAMSVSGESVNRDLMTYKVSY